MYAGQAQPIPIRTTAAHIPQQGLVPAPPKVSGLARGTAYRPSAPSLRLAGSSPYAARIANAPAVQRARAAQRKAALAGMRGLAQDEADAFANMVSAAVASTQGAKTVQMAFTAAGAPVDETVEINRLITAHNTEVVTNYQAAANANRAGNLVPMLDKSGGVVMVDPSSDPDVASAVATKAAGNTVALAVGNPLASAALAVTPAQARAAAEWGQSGPNAQTALLAKAAVKAKASGLGRLGQAAATTATAAPALPSWAVYAAAAVGLYLLVK
jgi:hypothetical protein